MSSALSQKSLSTPFICGVRFSNDPEISLGTNPNNFNDVQLAIGATQDVYASISSLQYVQTSQRNKPGQEYNQKFQFQFPNGDTLIANRIEEIMTARVLILSLTDGSNMVLGRNDYYQNTRPTITSTNNTRTTQITFSCNSIFPVGKYTTLVASLLPQFFPIG